jgi:hypothetical protein
MEGKTLCVTDQVQSKRVFRIKLDIMQYKTCRSIKNVTLRSEQ